MLLICVEPLFTPRVLCCISQAFSAFRTLRDGLHFDCSVVSLVIVVIVVYTPVCVVVAVGVIN